MKELERISVSEHDNDLTSQNVGKLFATVVVGFNFLIMLEVRDEMRLQSTKDMRRSRFEFNRVGKKNLQKMTNEKISAKIKNNIIEKVKNGIFDNVKLHGDFFLE